MKILMISKALVTGPYQKKLEELARLPDVELVALVPPFWHERRVGVQRLERHHTTGYRLIETPMRFNGHHHVHYYPKLWGHLRRFRPDIVHVDEEPYNYATFHATMLARLVRAKVLFFTWQNLYRRYPLPFSMFEQINYRLSAMGVAGNQEATEVLGHKGYRGPMAVIPQFGVDPDMYYRHDIHRSGPPVIGYAGRLVPEKGVGDLLEAFARMKTRANLQIVGNGSERSRLELRATSLGIRDRVTFRGAVGPAAMAEIYSNFDVMVVPSRTQENWKEQFGRVIIEAMACEVPVIGSDSGEIPNVIGDAGVVFPEGDINALASHLDDLLANDERRLALAERARQRVQQEFTQARVAERYYQVYRGLLSGRQGHDSSAGSDRHEGED